MTPRGTLDKVTEELDEVRAAWDDADALRGEVGDLLLAVVNLARHRGVDPESALRVATAKFRAPRRGVPGPGYRAGHRHQDCGSCRGRRALGRGQAGRTPAGRRSLSGTASETTGSPPSLGGMCRNITELRGLQPPATAEEISAAARQYIRKVSGLSKVPATAEVVFEDAVREVAEITTRLLESLPDRRQPPPTVPPLRRPEVQARIRARAAAS